MTSIELNGQWKMKDIKKKEWINAHVPGSVFLDLLNAGKAPDPYYRDNEDKIAPLFREAYEYSREFLVRREVLKYDKVILCCEGLDTLSKISLNGREIANTNNMHRTYRFDVKDLLQEGTNTIHIVFSSPVAFVEKKAAESTGMSLMGGKGIEHLRKAQCMFGWDWGLALPDSGIWRDIYIECFNEGKIEDVHILQEHNSGKVTLKIKSSCKVLSKKNLEVSVNTTSPDGKKNSAAGQVNAECDESLACIIIADPQLWWPNGFGEQPLYQVEVLLKDGDTLLDSKQLQIGLRTIYLRREEDKWGKSYEFVVNGKALFIKGSDLIIEDALLGRCSRGKTEQMIKSCVDANFNCIRVWGGANYPADYFYDLCDKYGLILYHDLMFACNFYPTDVEFLENVKYEVTDNVKRVRHHACIGLWNGNNEIEVIYGMCASQEAEFVEMRKQFGIPEMNANIQQKIKADYVRIFYELLPEILQKLDPDTCFVNSSPSSDEPCAVSLFKDSNRGDAHYYLSYDNLSPYSKMRSLNFRFVSEMGFQSYPGIKTIDSFTLPEDRKPDTQIMLKHQKCNNGNPIIAAYMNQDYKTPKNFEYYVYTSQIIAGEILRYSVEHLRRNEGRCMGVITWQLNDCWPAVSWAGIDYYGRWKAQQYYSKRFYSPILISALDVGTAMDLWVTNDTPKDVYGSASWRLLNSKSQVIDHGSKNINAKTCKSENFVHLDFSDKINDTNNGDYYVEFTFSDGNGIVSRGTALFVKPKDFHFVDPQIMLDIKEATNKFYITLESAAFAKSVGLELSKSDCIFSDNYFDLCGTAASVTWVE